MDQIHGVTFERARVSFARGETLVALDPQSGALVREITVAAHAGTAFDGEYLWIPPRAPRLERPLSQGRTSALCKIDGLQWVGHGRPVPGDERRHYAPHRPFTPRCLLCVVQRPFELEPWGSLTGHKLPSTLKSWHLESGLSAVESASELRMMWRSLAPRLREAHTIAVVAAGCPPDRRSTSGTEFPQLAA